ncbi:MAG: hypothetical protein C0412_00060 [Flavobacterium sp.]|nr:hypothetical protein [Flavobacterium sp.]
MLETKINSYQFSSIPLIIMLIPLILIKEVLSPDYFSQTFVKSNIVVIIICYWLYFCTIIYCLLIVFYNVKYKATLKHTSKLLTGEDEENIRRAKINIENEQTVQLEITNRLKSYDLAVSDTKKNNLPRDLGIGLALGWLIKLLFGFAIPGVVFALKKFNELNERDRFELNLRNKLKPEIIPVYYHPQMSYKQKDLFFKIRTLVKANSIMLVLFWIFLIAQYPINYSNEIAAAKFKEAKVYYNRGVHKSNLSDIEGAIKEYNKAIEIYRDYDYAYYNRGVLMSKLGSDREANEDYSKAIECNPSFVDAYIKRGDARSERGNQYEAFQDLNKAIEISPQNAEAYFSRGLAKYRNKDYKKSIIDFTEAIKWNSNYEEAYLYRGIARNKLADNLGALQDYSKAIEIKPNNVAAYFDRGIAKYFLSDYKGAINDYTEAIKLNPKFALAYHNRGALQELQADYNGAIQDYSKAIEYDSCLSKTFSIRGNVFMKLGDIYSACKDWRKASSLGQYEVDMLIDKYCRAYCK